MVLEYAEPALAALAIVGVLYSLYTGWLPNKLRHMVGFYELRSQIYDVKDYTEDLKNDHRETMDELHTLKHGQLAIAEAVDNEHGSVAVEKLREAHFGERDHANDFLRGGGDYRTSDD